MFKFIKYLRAGDFDKYNMESNEDITDFTSKNIKILPPHVEELKRQVSLCCVKVKTNYISLFFLIVLLF